MSDSALRRPLALTATIAASVAAAAGLVAPAANATTASPHGTANLTISGGSTAAPSASGTVTGIKYALGFAPRTQNLAWAPTGARAAWIDPATNAVVAGIPGGAAEVIAATPGAGGAPTVQRLPTSVVLASGTNWPDALSGGAMAAHRDVPLLLTDPKVLPGPTGYYLGAKNNPITTATLVGGTAAISPAAATAVGNSFSYPGQWDLVTIH
jgi:hypothetical protein